MKVTANTYSFQAWKNAITAVAAVERKNKGEFMCVWTGGDRPLENQRDDRQHESGVSQDETVQGVQQIESVEQREQWHHHQCLRKHLREQQHDDCDDLTPERESRQCVGEGDAEAYRDD